MITDFDTIIIGAGAAGLFAACNIEKGKTLILEKNNTAGKKLLISGAGQCNYTHSGDSDDFINKYGENGSFLKPALYNFKNVDAIDFFKLSGVESIIREDGKVFPESLKSADILNSLIKKCKLNNIEIKYNSPVKSISYNHELKQFTVKTNSEKFTSKNVLISTGGSSYPNTGSNGDGFILASSLGHNIVNTLPCLSPVNVKNYSFSDLSGISFSDIRISLWRNNRKIKETSGDVLLTHKNLSGPGILNFSRYIEKDDNLKLNFIGIREDELSGLIDTKTRENGKQVLKSIFKEMNISKRFIEKTFEINSISEDTICSQLNKKDKSNLIKSLCEHSFEVESLEGYHLAMATRGGVALDEVNRKTMQSKIISGLYLAGEVLNIDGDTGGYNIQAAFSTAALAAKDINRNLSYNRGITDV